MLGGQQRAVVLAQPERLHPAVFQDIAAEGIRNGAALHAALPAGSIGRPECYRHCRCCGTPASR